MLESLLNVLGAAISLLSDHEKTKYQDRFIDLKGRYYAEFNKAPALRDDATLDNIQLELRILADAFASSVGKQNAPAKS